MRFCFLLCWFISGALMAGGQAVVDLSDLPSLQRGAKYFMNYCSGCHGLKYLRYQTMAQDIGIVDSKGKILDEALKGSLMFTGSKVTDPMISAMRKTDGVKWFGIAPPDLSLVAKSRGPQWIYAYLHGFYKDEKRPFGVNNHVYPDVAMPDVLMELQNQLSPEEYDRMVADLVNFLSYAAEPMQLTRKHIGMWVLLFLGVLLVFAALLKREYWKDVS